MKFEIAICKREKRCSIGGERIFKDEIFFIQKYWTEGEDYPTKKNVCVNCAKKLCDDSFIQYLNQLGNALLEMKRRHTKVF